MSVPSETEIRPSRAGELAEVRRIMHAELKGLCDTAMNGTTLIAREAALERIGEIRLLAHRAGIDQLQWRTLLLDISSRGEQPPLPYPPGGTT